MTRQVYRVGSHRSPTTETHHFMRGHQAHLDIREHTDPNVIVRVDFEVSTDGGLTWSYGGGFTKNGDPHPVDKNGRPMHYCVVHFGHDAPTTAPAPERLIRHVIHVVGGPVSTGLHVAGTQMPNIDESLIPAD